MSTNNNIDNNPRGACAHGFGGKLMFLLLGGGIGAAIALLFAPKPGKELRRDIADAAARGYDETIEAAGRVKERSLEYLDAAKEKGAEVFDVLADDAEKIGDMVSGAARRVTDTVRSRHII